MQVTRIQYTTYKIPAFYHSKNGVSSLNVEPVTVPVQTYISNVTFGYNKDSQFLLSLANRLVCAYSGKEMLSPKEFTKICDKLRSKPNIQSATRFLFQFQKDFMHPVESEVFDMLNSKESLKYHGNETFKEALLREQPASLKRLKIKQINILNSTDSLIRKMSAPVASMIKMVRDDTIAKVNNDTFGRKSPLAMLRSIKTSGKDIGLLDALYQKWYTLPTSSGDYDAFVVKYSKKEHEQIAARLLSGSVATIEHIVPKSQGGSSSLENYILVSAAYNNERSSEPLIKYIELHKELNIETNLQKYIDLVVKEINDKKSPFHQFAWYPDSILQAIVKETKNKIQPKVSGMNIPQKEINQKEICANRLGKKFKVTR